MTLIRFVQREVLCYQIMLNSWTITVVVGVQKQKAKQILNIYNCHYSHWDVNTNPPL